MANSFAQSNVFQFLFHNFQRAQRTHAFVSPVPQTDCVLNKSTAGFGLLPKVVGSFFGNDHLGLKSHFFVEMLANVMEQAPDIAGLRALISNGKRRVDKRYVGERAQENNCVQEV